MEARTYMEPRGLLAPLRRDQKRDFASGSGRELDLSKVVQALLTEGSTERSSGELPWRTAFGAGIHLLRHERNDEVLEELARVRVRDGLARWVPGIEVTVLSVTCDGATLVVRLSFRGAAGAEQKTVEVRA
jgi:phage baseplate assembly protein W